LSDVNRTGNVLILLAALAYGCAGSSTPEAAVEGSLRYGPIHGFTQIPSAGSGGSTSSQRPTFGELGISRAEVYDVEGRAGESGNDVFAGYRWLAPSGSATLGDDLTSQGNLFQAGTLVRKSDTFSLARVGYEREAALGARSIVLAPQLGFLFFDFHDRLEGTDGAIVSRGFSRGTFTAGVRLELRPTELLGLAVRAFATPPLTNLPAVYSLEGRLGIHVGSFAEVFVGTGFDWYEIEDSERPLHNDVRVLLGPLFVGGLELGF